MLCISPCAPWTGPPLWRREGELAQSVTVCVLAPKKGLEGSVSA